MPSRRVVLLVHYEPRAIERAKAFLEGSGLAVRVAADGAAAVSTFSEIKPDVVLILEAMLPKKHGFEICKEIKATPEGKKTPVVIMTAVYKGRKYRAEATRVYGASEFVERPCGDDKMLEAIHRVLPTRPDPERRTAADSSAADSSGPAESIEPIEILDPAVSDDAVSPMSMDEPPAAAGSAHAEGHEPLPEPVEVTPASSPASDANASLVDRRSSGSADGADSDILDRVEGLFGEAADRDAASVPAGVGASVSRGNSGNGRSGNVSLPKPPPGNQPSQRVWSNVPNLENEIESALDALEDDVEDAAISSKVDTATEEFSRTMESSGQISTMPSGTSPVQRSTPAEGRPADHPAAFSPSADPNASVTRPGQGAVSAWPKKTATSDLPLPTAPLPPPSPWNSRAILYGSGGAALVLILVLAWLLLGS